MKVSERFHDRRRRRVPRRRQALTITGIVKKGRRCPLVGAKQSNCLLRRMDGRCNWLARAIRSKSRDIAPSPPICHLQRLTERSAPPLAHSRQKVAPKRKRVLFARESNAAECVGVVRVRGQVRRDGGRSCEENA